MVFNCQECRERFLKAIHASLKAKESYILSIERTTPGNLPITGLSFDIYPWHQYCALSLRLTSDQARYEPAEWQHFEFASSQENNIPSLAEAAQYVAEAYLPLLEDDKTSEARDLAHLIFWVGAEALLNDSVANCLRSVGINAPIVRSQLPQDHVFEYMVFDGMERFVPIIVK